MSRDDSGTFLPHYAGTRDREEKPLRHHRPGRRRRSSWRSPSSKGRKTRPDIKLGICGEHGGDPDSVKFCHKLGLNYVSCSPFRVPVARLAAAQAALA